MARSISFIVDGLINTVVIVREITLVDGRIALEFNLHVLDGIPGSPTGDLRAVFFDLNDTLFDGSSAMLDADLLTVTGADVTSVQAAEASVVSMGKDANIKGEVVKDFGAFDVGIEFGTPGYIEDDIQNTSFTLALEGGDLNLEILDFADFGLRYTSLGTMGEFGEGIIDRNGGGEKVGRKMLGVAVNDAWSVVENGVGSDELIGGGDSALDDSYAASGPPPRIHSVNVEGMPTFPSDDAGTFASLVAVDGLELGTLTVEADGTATFVADGADVDALGLGETVAIKGSYQSEIIEANGAGAYAWADFTITVIGGNDAPVVSISGPTGFGSVSSALGQVLSDGGTVTYADIDATDIVTVTAAPAGEVTWSGGTVDPALGAALLAGFSVEPGGTGNSGSVSWSYLAENVDLSFLAFGDELSWSVDVTATDSAGASDTEQLTFSVVGTNHAPVFETGSSEPLGDELVVAPGFENGPALAAVGHDNGQFGDALLAVLENGSIAVSTFDYNYGVNNSFSRHNYVTVISQTGQFVERTSFVSRPRETDPSDSLIPKDEPAHLAKLADGGFVALWGASDAAEQPFYNNHVRMQVFNGDGSQRSPEEILFTGIYTEGDFNATQPFIEDVVGLENGNFAVIVNEVQSVSGGPYGVNYDTRIIVATKAGGIVRDFYLEKGAPSTGGTLKLTPTKAGGFLATWTEAVRNENGAAEVTGHAQLFDDRGFDLYARWNLGSSLTYHDVAELEDGRFVVLRSNSSGIWAEFLDPAGAPLTVPALITPSDQLYRGVDPAVVGLANGGFAVTWTSVGYLAQTYVQVFDADGAAVGDLINLGEETNGASIYDAEIAISKDGLVTVLWQDENEERGQDFYVKSFLLPGGGTTADTTGTITELADGATGEGSFLHSVAGSVPFTDPDPDEEHTLTVTPAGADYLGDFFSEIRGVPAGAGQGVLNWTLDVGDADLEVMAGGEIREQIYDIVLTDKAGASDSVQVVVSLVGSNDAPVAEIGHLAEGEYGETISGVLSATDVDTPLADLSFSVTTGPEHGSLSLNADGSYDYTPDAGFFGEDSFSFEVSDGQDADAQTATVRVGSAGDVALVRASTPTLGLEPWLFDGTTARLIGDLNPGSGTTVLGGSVMVDETLYFLAVISGYAQLWQVDTQTGVASEFPLPEGMQVPTNGALVAHEGDLYFAGRTPLGDGYDTQMWKVSISSGEVSPISDINPSGDDMVTLRVGGDGDAQLVDGKIFFSATDGNLGEELWSYDTVADAVALEADIISGPNGSSPFAFGGFTQINDELIFFAKSPVFSPVFFQSYLSYDLVSGEIVDLVPGRGTEAIPIISPNDQTDPQGVVYGDTFLAPVVISPNASAILAYDQSAQSSQFIEIPEEDAVDFRPSYFGGAVTDGKDIYFIATSYAHGTELWHLDAETFEAERLTDVVEGSGSGAIPMRNLFFFEDVVYFSARPDLGGAKIGAYDTISDSVEFFAPGADDGMVGSNIIGVLNDKLFFRAIDPDRQASVTYYSDGAPEDDGSFVPFVADGQEVDIFFL